MYIFTHILFPEWIFFFFLHLASVNQEKKSCFCADLSEIMLWGPFLHALLQARGNQAAREHFCDQPQRRDSGPLLPGPRSQGHICWLRMATELEPDTQPVCVLTFAHRTLTEPHNPTAN